jgi:sulfoacetaldehyde dehydrogenase
MNKISPWERETTEEQRAYIQELLAKARAAMEAIKDYDQATVDRLCQAIAWAAANEKTFTRLAQMGVEESDLGDPQGRVSKRFKIMGILRDALRQKSMGIVEEDPEKSLVKYAKPAGVIASLIPTTNPGLTSPGTAIYALKAKDAVIFSPHPRSKGTTFEAVRIMRETLKKQGATGDLFQCIKNPSIPVTQELMTVCDLTMATGGKPMVRATYSSGKPAYGVGAGNSTMVIDETANIEEAARNTRISKTSNFGSGCSADGNLIVEASIYDALIAQLQAEGGYLCSDEEKAKVE